MVRLHQLPPVARTPSTKPLHFVSCARPARGPEKVEKAIMGGRANAQIHYPKVICFAYSPGGTTSFSTSLYYITLLSNTSRDILFPVDMPTPIAKKIGDNIRRIREEKDLNQRALCKKMGLDAAYLSNIESGKTNPTVATIEKIAKALGVRVEDLMK